MAGEWRRERFGRMALLVRETVHPSDAAGLPCIGLEHIGEGTLQLLGTGTAENATSLKARFKAGDILFGKLRPYFRKVIRAPFDGICSTDIWVVRPQPGVDAGFLFYLMASNLFLEPVVRASEGTKMPRAKWEYAASLELPFPPLPEQRAIAHILGTLDDEIQARGGQYKGMRRILDHLINQLVSGKWTAEEGSRWMALARQFIEPLDDKIELNRRMSETLEAMARALFKAWFVDFEPVRAKMEGRWRRGESLPGLPGTGGFPTRPYADLFPDRLVDSELGEIPEGWEVGTLGEVAEHPRRNARPEEIDSQTPYIALEHMPKRCISLFDWGTAEGLESNKFKFKKGEILFGKLRPYFHKVGIAPVDGVCSTDIVVVIPRRPVWFGFVLGHISSVDFVEYTNAGSTGTKMPRTSWADMARYEVVLPPEPVAAAFTGLVEPLIERIIHSIYDSRTLAALRDALLPKLISGELRVEDAERFLEERGL